MEEERQITHSGFIALLGRPNVGKSTFLNHVLGEKIVITSPRPQTTRNRVTGVVNRGNAQLIFFDTPGIHKSDKLINRYMSREALSCLDEVDAVIFLVDATESLGGGDRFIAAQLREKKIPVFLVANKIDLNRPRIVEYDRFYPSASLHCISSTTGEGVDILLDALVAAMPEGPRFYPEDEITDRPERFIAQEYIREKVFELMEEEVPYSVAVTVDAWEDKDEGDLVVLHATIHVERQSQKGMIIGKQGSRIKDIGKRARTDLEKLLGVRVYLDLHVAVEKNWTKNPKLLHRFGYEV